MKRRLLSAALAAGLLGLAVPVGMGSVGMGSVGSGVALAASVPSTTDGATLVHWLRQRADPDYAYRVRLSYAQKKSVRRYLTPTSVTIYRRGWRVDAPINGAAGTETGTTAGTTAATDVANGAYDHLVYRNWLGGTVWEYDLDLSWYSSSGSGLFSYTHATASAPVVGLFWYYRPVSRQETAGVGFDRWSVFVQAQFEFCILKVGCLASYWPYKDAEVTPASASWTTGGF